jgi:HEAT repeat protein
MPRLLASSLFLILVASPAKAYVDISPTIGWLINDADAITVLQVDKTSVERRAILFKKVADLKGTFPDATVKHHIAEGFHPREPKMVMDWAEPGKVAICFSKGKTAVVCLGRYWYQCGALEDSWWAMSTGMPELALAFYGRIEKLRDAIKDMLAGKEVVISAVSHGTQKGVWQYSNVAYQKVLRGKECPIWRIKASLKMPTSVWEIGVKDSRWVVGEGFVDIEEMPGLLKTLEDPKAEKLARSRAASDLGLIGWQAHAALPALQKACQDPEALVRVRAARATALVSEEYSGPVAVLKKELRNKEVSIRKAAAVSLGDLGADARGATWALREALSDEDPGVRWSVAEALGRIGPAAAAAVPALAAALRDPAMRVIAADSLGGIGPAARGAVPLLTDAIQDKDPDYRWTAAIALSRIDPRAARVALPLFIEKLRNGDLRARWDAAMYLQPMGYEAKPAAEALHAWAKNGNGVAAGALALIAGPEALDVLYILLRVLHDEWDTTDNIAHIGPAAVPEVLKQFRDPDGKSRHLLIKALGLLAPKANEVIPVIVDALGDRDPAVRKAAAVALGSIEPPVRTAAPRLVEALRDAEPSVRLAAAAALRVLSDEPEPALAALLALLAHDKPEVRRDAAAGLAAFGASAKEAVVPLRQAMNDPDAGVRSAAACAVARVTTAAANRDSVVVMIQALKDEDPRARQDAARFLGSIGPDARDAIAALVEARRDDNEDVRRAASEALVKIRAH